MSTSGQETSRDQPQDVVLYKVLNPGILKMLNFNCLVFIINLLVTTCTAFRISLFVFHRRKKVTHVWDVKRDGKLTAKKVISLDNELSILHFQYQLSEQLSWSMQTVLSGHSLFVGITNGELLKGTREGLTSVLEFAEEKLKINHVFLWFMKSRPDALLLTRTFFCLGFELVKPDHLITSIAGNLRLMVYTIQQMHSSEE